MRVLGVTSIETEHLLSATTYEGRVKLRVQTDGGVTALAQLTCEQARQIAHHILESAARSEYEADLYREMVRCGVEDPVISMTFQFVRAGEIRRHVKPS